MPNHVTNKIIFKGNQENIDTILNIIKGVDTYIDFNKIIPMPENIFRGDLGTKERELYGADNWYDWSISHWGTKWNAYSTELDKESNTLIFDTAWSCPLEVLSKLANICYEHNVSFEGKWADEDASYNVGRFESYDEFLYYENVENASNEAYEIYFELKGESDCFHKDKYGYWQRYNCDDCPHKCY